MSDPAPPEGTAPAPPRGTAPVPPDATPVRPVNAETAPSESLPPIGVGTALSISVVAGLLTAAAVAALVWATMGIIGQWTPLRLMIVIIAGVGLILLGSSAWVAALEVAAASRVRLRRRMEQNLGEEAVSALAESLASVFASAKSAGRLALGGTLHLWAAGILAAVDLIYKGGALR
jgi:hypothetical protein